MPYFEMSLENDREYVYQNDSSVVESDLGMWMVVFLDVDWGDQIKKAEALLGEEELPQSGLGFIKGMDYGQRVAAWYRELKSSLSPQHPLLKLLVEQQLRNRLCCAVSSTRRSRGSCGRRSLLTSRSWMELMQSMRK